MRDNSGKGKSSNNNRNPTLRELERAGGHRPPAPASADDVQIVGNAKLRGEDPSPDDRRRGETSIADKIPGVERQDTQTADNGGRDDRQQTN